MRSISKERAVEIAKKKCRNRRDVDPLRADGIVAPTLGQVIGVPIAKHVDFETLKRGALVGGIDVDYAPRSALLEDGYYEMRVREIGDGWVAQFIKDGQVVSSTVNVRVIPTEYVGPPQITLNGNALWAFLLGVIVG